jgi:hypothetical protein
MKLMRLQASMVCFLCRQCPVRLKAAGITAALAISTHCTTHAHARTHTEDESSKAVFFFDTFPFSRDAATVEGEAVPQPTHRAYGRRMPCVWCCLSPSPSAIVNPITMPCRTERTRAKTWHEERFRAIVLASLTSGAVAPLTWVAWACLSSVISATMAGEL